LAQGEFNPHSQTIKQAHASLTEPSRKAAFFCAGFMQLVWESVPKSITACFLAAFDFVA